jgi:hypothetical protein
MPIRIYIKLPPEWGGRVRPAFPPCLFEQIKTAYLRWRDLWMNLER